MHDPFIIQDNAISDKNLRDTPTARWVEETAPGKRGGFDYLTSLGDPKKAETGKTKITRAITGFIIIFAAYWITQAVAFMLGLKGAGF